MKLVLLLVIVLHFGCVEYTNVNKKIDDLETIDSVGLPLGIDLNEFYIFPDKWKVENPYPVDLDTIRKNIHEIKWDELSWKFYDINKAGEIDVAIVDLDSLEMPNYSHNKNVEFIKFKLPDVKSHEVYFMFYIGTVIQVGNLVFVDKKSKLKTIVNVYLVDFYQFSCYNQLYFIDTNYQIQLTKFFYDGKEGYKKVNERTLYLEEYLEEDK